MLPDITVASIPTVVVQMYKETTPNNCSFLPKRPKSLLKRLVSWSAFKVSYFYMAADLRFAIFVEI